MVGLGLIPRKLAATPGASRPLGVIPLSPAIEAHARKRLSKIKADLGEAGTFYPRAEVEAAWPTGEFNWGATIWTNRVSRKASYSMP
jgi:hypothetical protein